MSNIAHADALDWLERFYGKADLILTDPPHLDQFESVVEHASFVRSWIPIAFGALIPPGVTHPGGILYHTCGSSPTELANYLAVKTPDQIRIWPHEEGCHFHLVYRTRIAGDIVWDDKPRPLWDRIVRTLTDLGDLVLDPFCGRGEIPFAARSLSLRYAGCDLNPESVEYCRGLGL